MSILGLLRADSTLVSRVGKAGPLKLEIGQSSATIDLRIRFIRRCVEALDRRSRFLQLFLDVKIANAAIDDDVSNCAHFDGLI